MSRGCLNYDSRTRHEMNGREPTWVWRPGGVGHDYSVCPRFVRPISKCADAIILGKRKLRIARKEAELADLSKLHAYRGWCAGSNPVASGAPPVQRKSPPLHRIVEVTKIEIVM